MTRFFGVLIKGIAKIIVGVWDFVFFFFGFPYEEQAGKLNLDDIDHLIRGPENEKTSHQFYRANKVSNES